MPQSIVIPQRHYLSFPMRIRFCFFGCHSAAKPRNLLFVASHTQYTNGKTALKLATVQSSKKKKQFKDQCCQLLFLNQSISNSIGLDAAIIRPYRRR
jgi:hypothetical protein